MLERNKNKWSLILNKMKEKWGMESCYLSNGNSQYPCCTFTFTPDVQCDLVKDSSFERTDISLH